MPVPLPSATDVLLIPPEAAEVHVVARGIASAIAPDDGLTELQHMLLAAICESMTGFEIDSYALEPIEATAFAEALRRRDLAFRTRIVQLMVLGELVLVPLPAGVAERVELFARELGVEEGMIHVARRYANGSLGLALIDFERNGYTSDWDAHRSEHLHTSTALAQAWDQVVNDPELAARWATLEACAPGSLGRRVFEFYRARGFRFPGLPDSAPPYLAQHDWVHVLADYGTTVESELEVFGLIGRAIPDPRGFSLLAMVIGLFETGYLRAAAGLFAYDIGHLSKAGMATRLGDAMRRGALCGKDLMAVDWFEHADRSVGDVRKEFGIVPKSAKALVAGSVGPWEWGGISPYQLECGRRAADAEGRPYDAYGAAAG